MRKKKINLFSFLVFITFVIMLSAFPTFAEASGQDESERICQGVFIDEVEVSGMTKEKAQEAIDKFVKELQEKNIAIRVNDNLVKTKLVDLGYDILPNDFIDQALAIGKKGNLIKRYKEIKDIEHGGYIYTPQYKVDIRKIKGLVSEEVSSYNISPIDAKVTRTNGKFVYTDHQIGNKVEVEATSRMIEDKILNDWNRADIFLEAIMVEDKPVYTREHVEKCNSLLGTFSTTYENSAEGRAANLANGAKLINNAIIYPGEVFSAYEYLTPFTQANGYYEAGAYSQGKVIDSIGGGACQVTTTLYNAVLRAELEVVERQAHSMTVSYVELATDAAIAGTYKDLKFKNDTDVPILIEAFTEGRKITFNIWGHEERDTKNRRVEFVTKVVDETRPPKDVITEDPSKPVTYKKVTQSAHTGYIAELYKVIYENGEKVSETLVNRSKYNASPRYITIGTKPLKEEKPDKEKDEDGQPINGGGIFDRIKNRKGQDNSQDNQEENKENTETTTTPEPTKKTDENEE